MSDERVTGQPADEIIELLTWGVAAELNDAYHNLLLSKIACRAHAVPVAELFARAAADGWAHVALLTGRVLQLGGTPPASAADAGAVFHAYRREVPVDPADLRSMLSDSLDGERAAICFYHGLFRRARPGDPVTAELALGALADEISDEDDLQRLLARWPNGSRGAPPSTAARQRQFAAQPAQPDGRRAAQQSGSGDDPGRSADRQGGGR